MISGGLGVLFLCFSVISSLEMSSDGLRMDECGAIVIPQEKTAAGLLPDICASWDECIRCCVERTGFDGDKPRRTGKRLFLGEGAGYRPEGPKSPLGAPLRQRPCVLSS